MLLNIKRRFEVSKRLLHKIKNVKLSIKYTTLFSGVIYFKSVNFT